MFKKGHPAYGGFETRFKKGSIPYVKGKNKYNCEAVRKVSEKLTGRKFTEEHRLNLGGKRGMNSKLSETRKKLFEEGKLSISIVNHPETSKRNALKSKTPNPEGLKYAWAICKQCNNTFEVEYYRKNEAKFCSMKCFGESKRGIDPLKGKTRPNFAGVKNPFYGKHHTKESMMKKKSTMIERGVSQTGKNHPNWHGGISFEPYDCGFNKKFKCLIRKRDNHICMKCNKHQESLSKTLTVHHINYDKKLSIPENCCALCFSCNAEVNFNRPHWIKFFQSLLSERYGYKYSEKEEVILEICQK